MKKKFLKKAVCLTITVLFVVTTFNITILSKEVEKNTPRNLLSGTLIVDNEGDGDFTTIQDALDAANDGDTIEVYSGTYIEIIDINIEINLIGKDTEYLNGSDMGKPILDGNSVDNVITVFTSGENKPVSIIGFIIQNSGDRDSGIFVDYSTDVLISENDIINNHHGINIYHSCTTIEENHISNNDWGILSEFSDHCIITENQIIENNVGMQLESAHELTINRNIFEKNEEYGLILIRSPLNEIAFNNFLDNGNHAWFQNCINQWHDNYWGNRVINLPVYVIIGIIQFSVFPTLIIPIPQFDLRVKTTPN
jgi:parallel beta-helix repeat protein